MEGHRTGSLNQRMAALMSDLEELSDEVRHPEGFNQSPAWDRLTELQSFASRILRPSGVLVEVLQQMTDEAVRDSHVAGDREEFLQRLEKLEKENKSRFLPKTSNDIA